MGRASQAEEEGEVTGYPVEVHVMLQVVLHM